MNISSETILIKMEKLVAQAKQAETEEKLKGCIMAIQTLCDLLSPASQEVAPVQSAAAVRPPFAEAPQPQAPVYTQPQTVSFQPVPVKIDEANGDSLLDF